MRTYFLFMPYPSLPLPQQALPLLTPSHPIYSYLLTPPRAAVSSSLLDVIRFGFLLEGAATTSYDQACTESTPQVTNSHYVNPP